METFLQFLHFTGFRFDEDHVFQLEKRLKPDLLVNPGVGSQLFEDF